MKGTVKFSIIIPVYNAERYVSETINSIVKADYENLEILLIDDGSTDKSGEICKQFANDDSRIKYVYKENGGVASARNIGISMASGDYTMFLDSDDYYRPGIFSKLESTIKETDCDICQYGVSVFSNEKEEEYPMVSEDLVLKEDEVKKMMVSILTGNYIPSGIDGITEGILARSITNAAVKTKIIKENNLKFFCFWNNEDDWIFAVLCYKNAKKVSFVKECYYRYRKDGDSLSNSKRFIADIYKKRKESIKWISAQLDDLKSENPERIEQYKGVLQRKLILYVLYNESATPHKAIIKNAVEHIRTAFETEKEIGFRDTILCDAGGVEKVLFFLIIHRLEWVAFLLNKYLIKKYR